MRSVKARASFPSLPPFLVGLGVRVAGVVSFCRRERQAMGLRSDGWEYGMRDK